MNKPIALVGAVLWSLTAAGTAQAGTNAQYPYKSAAFTRFVADSYRNANAGDARQFYRWMNAACRRRDPKWPGWTNLLRARRRQIAALTDPDKRAEAERAQGAWLHRKIKTIIPKFSLDRGFEFVQTVKRGERQCFLQSTLIASLLQAMDINAGVAMVYKNERGDSCNNGHAVTLLQLSDGQDIIVDASDPTPFSPHQGLFAGQDGAYRYVNPVYKPGSPVIVGYRPAGGGPALAPRAIQTLDTNFLRSQFDYYRGERTPGGLLSPRITPAGLNEEARHLRVSVRECHKTRSPSTCWGGCGGNREREMRRGPNS